MSKKVLVTGSSGFIGTNLVLKLLSKGFDVIGVDRNPPNEVIAEMKGYSHHVIDMRNELSAFMNGIEFDYLIHLAALSSPRQCTDLDESKSINVDVTKDLLKIVKKRLEHHKTKKAILMSTALIYKQNQEMPLTEESELDPKQNIYIMTKAADESLAMDLIEQGFDIIVFRPTNVYGPYQDYIHQPTLIPQVIGQAIKKGKITIWNSSPVRDWVFVEDVTDAMIKALDSSFKGILNLSSGKGTSVGEIIKLIATELGCSIVNENRKVEGPLLVICDISKAQKKIDWSPKTSIEDGLKKTISFYKKAINKQ